ncbi:hypothetical protein [Methylomagnum sp.]
MHHARKQEICLDAIEYSFSMAKTAYKRIIDYCRHDSILNNSNNDEAMVLDAWSFIDVTKRLRSVLQNTPGLKKSNFLEAFLSETVKIPDFRHYVQHIEEKTKDVSKTGRPIWGSFSWVILDQESKEFKIITYVPGRLAKINGIPVVNPSGRIFHDDVDHFEMTLGEVTINISQMARRIERLQERYLTALQLATQVKIRNEDILMINFDT